MKRVLIMLLIAFSPLFYGESNLLSASNPDTMLQDTKKFVRGIVKDNKGLPIPGASVIIPNSNIGTITGSDGSYSLNIPDGTQVLEISCLGYEAARIQIGTSEVYNIVLNDDTQALDEVVVVGYGTQKKVNLTGAVSQITTEDMSDRPITKMTQALQGQVPNLNIVFGSGKPGTSGSLNIRGTTSINGGSPLVLIDGVPGNMDQMNVNDVESISVLKDASASAIYGARAAYGVILITTKTAKEGKVRLNYQNNFGWATHVSSTDFVTDAWTNATINDQAFFNLNGTHLFKYNDEQWNELYIRRNDKTENPDRPWVTVSNVNGKDRYNYYANFDWFNYLYRKWRPRQNHNISVNGSSGKVRYLVSANYSSEDGIFRIKHDKEQRYNAMTKIDMDVKKWLTITNSFRFFRSDYSWYGFNQAFTPDNSSFTVGSNDAQFYSPYYHYHPQYVPVNPDGTLTGNSQMSNYTMGFGLHAIQLNGKSKGNEHNQNIQETAQLLFKILPGWTATANYSYYSARLSRWYRSVPVQYSINPGVMVTWNWDALKTDQLTEWSQDSYRHIINAFTNYDNSFGKHNIGATFGFNQEYYYQKLIKVANKELLSETLNDISLATGSSPTLTGSQTDYALRGVFGRINYNYAGKYLAEISGRYDGTSRFPKESRFAFFPSFSLGYRISEEQWFEPLKATINNLKIRYSYGALGNQDVSNYAYIQTMSVSNSSFLDKSGNYRRQTSVPSPVSDVLTWETATTNNLGLDLELFSGRLSFTGDIYERRTTDMLTTGKKLPSVYGATEPKENAASLKTDGYELSLTWKDGFNLAGKTFNYQIGGVFSDYQSYITEFDNPTGIIGQYRKGMKIGEIWGYHFDGRFATDEEAAEYTSRINVTSIQTRKVPGYHAGDTKILDLNGDGKINSGANTVDDPGDRTIIGNTTPRYSFGLTFSSNWNGFDLYVFFQGIGRRDWAPGSEATLFWGPYSRPYVSFMPKDFEDKIWSEDKPNAYFPRLIGQLSSRELGKPNTQYLQNTGYCKLRNLTIGYTLPKKVLQKVRIDNVRLFASGENLYTWTGLESAYIDPEEINSSNGDARTYPLNKSYSFGIDITF